MNKTLKITLSVYPIVLLFSILTSCSGQAISTKSPTKSQELKADADADNQIAQYVVEIYEDKKGNVWFGTIDYGAAMYDGKVLTYYAEKDGLVGNTVTSFAEDSLGNLWIGSHSGLSKFNGLSFVNYTTSDGLVNNSVSELLMDKSGILWIGTWGGVTKYDGKSFTTFPLPNPDIEFLYNPATKNWITEIIEDEHGNIWFGRDGYGAYVYDGNSIISYTKEEGLASNNIQAILEDHHGNIWLGSRIGERDNPNKAERNGEGGLTRFDGNTFSRYNDVKGLFKNEIFALHEDRKGNIWIGANGLGVYKYDGTNFTLYSKTDRADLMQFGYGIQDILEDSKGNMWFGLSGGLFMLRNDSIVNVTRNGILSNK